MSAVPLPDPRSVTVRAPAKINLFLGVGRVRPDGFHPLETLYQAVSLYDDVTATSADEWSVTTVTEGIHVDAAAVPDDEDNIVIRAGKALVAHHGADAEGRAAAIEIRKGIPVAGGMAGGSADAAATLVALDRLWDLDTSDDDLLAIAATLGSDVPFALIGGTAHGTGRGEIVTRVEDNGSWWWVVVFNDVGLPTPSVYAAFDLLAEDDDRTIDVHDAILQSLRVPEPPVMLGSWLRNDLTDAAFDLRPDLRKTFDDVSATPVREVHLSGSGPTMLGLAENADDAREAAAQLSERGYELVVVVHGPVAGSHVVDYG